MAQELASFIELLVYTVLAIAIVIPLIPERKGYAHYMLSLLATLIAIIAYASLWVATTSNPLVYYQGLVVHNRFTASILLAAAITSLLAIISIGVLALEWPSRPALYSLLPLVLFGLFYLAGSNDALVLLAAWLLVSIASYVIIATPPDASSRSAAVRYIFMGALATLFLALWVGLHVGIGEAGLTFKPYTGSKAVPVAIIALLAALGFKLGVVPFHWWLPSVYGRADGRVVSIVAGIVKLGFIAVLTRAIYALSGAGSSSQLALLISALAVATMIYGNIAALTTRRLQLILAYSSIAHIGYILTALAAVAYFKALDQKVVSLALGAIALHSMAYAFSKTPLFSLTGEFGGLRGLVTVSPTAAVAASILLLSLLGVPPFLGFWGKLYMFLAAIKYSLWLVLIALVNSGISAVYYAIAIRELLTRSEHPIFISDKVKVALVIGAALSIILGLIAPRILHFTSFP